MSLVLDGSLTLSWYFEDESKPASDAVLSLVKQQGAIAPSLWRLEVANGFQMAIRRKRINSAYRDKALVQLREIPITIDTSPDTYVWSTALQLAERFGLTVYDAVYLELAQRRRLPLATLDRELRVAAVALGLHVLGNED